MRTSDLAKYKLPVVSESVGFPNRKPGDMYYDPKNPEDVATFVSVITLPDDKPAFSSPSERDLAFNYWHQKLNKRNNRVYILNKPLSNMLGIYIVQLDVKGKQEYYVKFLGNTAHLAGKLKAIPPGIKSPDHGGYIYGAKKAESERIPIKPSQIFVTPGPYTAEQIYNKVRRYENDAVPAEVTKQMAYYIKQVMEGNAKSKIPGAASYQSLHEKYTGEIAAPIAVTVGDVQNPDVLSKAEQSITGGNFFKDAKIEFPISVTTRLIDSELVWPDGTKVGISSKSGVKGGAAASLEGLLETVDKNRDNPEFQKTVLQQYPAVIDLIEVVANHSALDGLLALYLKYRVLSKADVKLVIDMLNNIKEGKPQRNTTRKYLRSSKLKHLYKSYNAKTNRIGYNLFFHIVASAGKELEGKLNNLPITDAVKAILNFMSLVQVYIEGQASGKDLEMQGFRAVWPPVFEGTVKIDLSNLSSTSIQRKIAFKFQ